MSKQSYGRLEILNGSINDVRLEASHRRENVKEIKNVWRKEVGCGINAVRYMYTYTQQGCDAEGDGLQAQQQ